MAAGKFIYYDSAIAYMLKGNIDFLNDTIRAIPLHRGYTPGTHSHSALAQISGDQCTASATIVNAVTIGSKELSLSANGVIRMIGADINGFSSDGDTFDCKYIALYSQSSSGGTGDNLLIGFLDTNSGNTTGVEGTQLNVTWPSGNIGKITVNP